MPASGLPAAQGLLDVGTVLALDQIGASHDLFHHGRIAPGLRDLRGFWGNLHANGYYKVAIRDRKRQFFVGAGGSSGMAIWASRVGAAGAVQCLLSPNPLRKPRRTDPA